MMRTLTDGPIVIGARLPKLTLDLTPAMLVSTALATMDFTSVPAPPRARRDRAAREGVPFPMLTTIGLVERYVTDWAGPEALVCGINVKLGIPAHAGDHLILTGMVLFTTNGQYVIEVHGTVRDGRHATATVRLHIPRPEDERPVPATAG